MSFTFSQTGDKKTDEVVGEIANVLNWLKAEIDKKAEKKLLSDLLMFMSAHDQTLILVRYRRDGSDIVREYDTNYGAGSPNWVEWDRITP